VLILPCEQSSVVACFEEASSGTSVASALILGSCQDRAERTSLSGRRHQADTFIEVYCPVSERHLGREALAATVNFEATIIIAMDSQPGSACEMVMLHDVPTYCGYTSSVDWSSRGDGS
jgi:hypothetical protein